MDRVNTETGLLLDEVVSEERKVVPMCWELPTYVLTVNHAWFTGESEKPIEVGALVFVDIRMKCHKNASKIGV